MQTYNGSVVLQFDSNSTGNADSGATVAVREYNAVAGTGALASIFDADDNSILNPLTTDSRGNYSFKAPDGIYDIVIREGTPSQLILPAEVVSDFYSFHNGVVSMESLGGDVNADNGPIFLAYAASDSIMLDLGGKSWPAPSLNVDNGATRTLLRDNPVQNGSLDAGNSFGNVTTVKRESIYNKDEIGEVQTKSPVVSWDSREVLWLGTSMPHFGAGSDGYPELFGKRLNCTIYNWAWSGSHAFYDKDGDAFDAGTVRALSMTNADLAAGLATYGASSAYYGASSAYDDSFNLVTKASEMTTEYRIKAQFVANPNISVVMLDHNHNDRLNTVAYTANDKVISVAAIGTTTTFTVDNVTGLAVGDGCYVEVIGIDNLNYAAGRIQSITSNDVEVAIDSTGYTGSFTSGTLKWVDRNTINGAWDFLIAYIKNMSIVYGDGNINIVLCNSPSNYTNNLDPDFPIWSAGKAIAGVAVNWNLSYYDVAHDLEITYHDQLVYLEDGVHPTTVESRTVFANHWAKWAAGGAVPHIRHAEFLQAKESIPNQHQNVALYSKYDDRYAPRNELFSLDDPYLIDEDFSGTLSAWTVTGTTPVIEAAPWDAGAFAVKYTVTSGNAATRLNQLQAIGHDGYLSFDLWFDDVSISTGVSKQMTVASLVTSNATAYNVQVVQSVGGDLRLAIAYVDGNVNYLTIAYTKIEASTKYNIVFDIVKGDLTTDDGGLLVIVNGATVYTGDWTNGNIASSTGLQIGSVFTNMSNNYNFYIGNIQATSKSRESLPSFSAIAAPQIASQYTSTNITVAAGARVQEVAVDATVARTVTLDSAGWSQGDIVRINKMKATGTLTVNSTQTQENQSGATTTSFTTGTADQILHYVYTGSAWSYMITG